ncbi:Ornithine carbamoyltransferase [Globisporangium polare]
MVFIMRKLAQATLAKPSGVLLARRGFASSTDSALASLRNQSFLSTAQLSRDEFEALVAKAQEYKALYSDRATKATAPKPLAGEICSMIFQKRSTRTRISSEVGMHLLGGKALFLSSDDIQLGTNETMKDTALVLSRFNSIILARVFGHKDVEELAELATVPVINALSEKYHPLQALADYMTIKEHFGKLNGLTIAWVGDGNNVLHDYMIAAAKVGANIQIATPAGYEPDADVIEETKRLAKESGTKVLLTHDPIEAVSNANVIATDTWISMGQEEEGKIRKAHFAGYQVTKKMLTNAASDHVFLHCLPRHEEEVDDEVFYSDKSLVFDEAENRLWTVMAVYAALLGKF